LDTEFFRSIEAETQRCRIREVIFRESGIQNMLTELKLKLAQCKNNEKNKDTENGERTEIQEETYGGPRT
jgi:hypothetical protein